MSLGLLVDLCNPVKMHRNPTYRQRRATDYQPAAPAPGSLSAAMFGQPTSQPGFDAPMHLGVGGRPERKFSFGVPEAASGPVDDPWYEGTTAYMGTFEAAGQTQRPANHWEEASSLGSVGQSWQHHKSQARDARSKASALQAQAYHQMMRDKHITALQNRQQAAMYHLAQPATAMRGPRHPGIAPPPVPTRKQAPFQGPLRRPPQTAMAALDHVPPPRQLTRQMDVSRAVAAPPPVSSRVHTPDASSLRLHATRKAVRFADDHVQAPVPPAVVSSPPQQHKPRRPNVPKVQPLQGGGLDRPIDAYHSEFCPDADGERPKPYVIKTEAQVLKEVGRFDKMDSFDVVNGEIVVPEEVVSDDEEDEEDEVADGVQIGPLRFSPGTIHADIKLFLEDAQTYVNTMLQRGRDAGLTGMELKSFAETGVRIMVDLTSNDEDEESESDGDEAEDAVADDEAEDTIVEDEETDGETEETEETEPAAVPDAVEPDAEPADVEPADATADVEPDADDDVDIVDEGEDVRVFHADGSVQRLSEEEARAQATETGSDELNPDDPASWTYDNLHTLNCKSLKTYCSKHGIVLGSKYVNKDGLIAKLLELQ